VADNSLLSHNFLDDRMDLFKSRRMLQINRLDASNAFSIVLDHGIWVHQSIKNNITVEVYDWDSSKSFSVVCQDSLAVEG